MKNQDQQPLVSVILSTYNGRQEWLGKALDSVFSQTWNNLEVIIVNDASTNDIEICILDYKKKYNNVKYLKNDKNLGLPACLNRALEVSCGKYIARIDDDDYWIDRDKLEKQVNFMENNPDYGLCGAGVVVNIDENDKIIFTEYKNRLSDKQIRDHMLQQNQIAHSSVLIRKKVLDELGFYKLDYIITEDYELWCRIGTKYKFINLQDVRLAYRVHANNISRNQRRHIYVLTCKVFWTYKNRYPNFYKALILRLGAFLLPDKLRKNILRKLKPNLAVAGSDFKNNKKNILVLNYEFPPIGGGAASVSYAICKGYEDNGFNVDVVTMGFKGLPVYEKKEGINIYRAKCIRRKKEVCRPYEQLTYLISGYLKVKQLLKQKKYDICHCHFLLPSGILALSLKKQFGLRYFVTSHGSDVPGYNPDRFTFLHRFTPKLLKKIINNSETVVCPSKYLADLIKTNIKGINKDIDIIPNGIDINKFIPLKKEKIILGTGRLWPLKGLHLLTEAFSEIEDVKGFELHICGDGPLMDKLKEIQKKSKNKIVLHGWTDNDSKEYIDLLGKSMIFCLPSVSESGSLSLLEGMSCGAILVTTNRGVCEEMAKDIGFYVEPSVKSIKKQLEYLIENYTLYKELGKKTRENAVSNYNKTDIIGKYVKRCMIIIDKFLIQ